MSERFYRDTALEPPIHDVPDFPEAREAGFHTLSVGPYTLNAEPPRVIENFLDVSHLMWVHEGLLGVPDYAEIPEHHVHRVGEGLVSDPINIFQPDPDGRGRALTNRYIYEVLAPTTARFRKTDPDTGEVFSMLLHATPTRTGETLALRAAVAQLRPRRARRDLHRLSEHADGAGQTHHRIPAPGKPAAGFAGRTAPQVGQVGGSVSAVSERVGGGVWHSLAHI